MIITQLAFGATRLCSAILLIIWLLPHLEGSYLNTRHLLQANSCLLVAYTICQPAVAATTAAAAAGATAARAAP